MDASFEIEKRRSYSRKKFRIIFLLSVGIFFLSLLGVLKLATIYQVKNVEISGNKRLDHEVLSRGLKEFVLSDLENDNFFLKFLGGDNFLVWYFSDWSKFLNNNSNLANLEAQFDFLKSSILFNVIEQDPWALWCNKNNCFWFDEKGVILENAPLVSGKLIYKIQDDSERSLSIGDSILLNKIFRDNLMAVISLLKESKLFIEKITLDRINFQEISVYLENGLRLDFSLRFKFNLTKNDFNALLQKIKYQNLEYVDFRVENRIYYKP